MPITFIVSADREKAVPIEEGSIHYINNAKICAMYYLRLDDDKRYLSAAEAALWEIRKGIEGISIQAANEYVESEMAHYLNEIEDEEARINDAVQEILILSLINQRDCLSIALSGNKNLRQTGQVSSKP